MEKIQKQKWKSQFMIVALGQAVSMLGSHGVQFALIWWLAERTSSPLMLGISGLVAYLPMTLFSPLAGIAADRYNRKFISVFSDMAMGAVALIYAVLLFFFDLPVWTVFVMLCVRGIGSTFQQPAIQSIIPQLVPKDQLVKTNMKHDLFNTEMDEIIRTSVKLADEPAPELNNKLKAALYQREAVMRKQPATRALSLWYLPMILNLAVFIMLAVVALMVIGNAYLSYFTAGICFYMGLTGILLTVLGVKRTNMKEDITIRVGKRGVLA